VWFIQLADDAITRVAHEEEADLIVVGSKAARSAREPSSVPKAVMDRAARAVLVA
jgi:nucleotide-binding universal stress UspA family protein